MVYDPSVPTNPPREHDIYEADYRVTEEGQIERRAPRPGGLRKRLGPIGVALAFILTKLKLVLVALKGITFFSTGFSALISVGAYALLFGWQLALGFVVLLFIHEMGHVLVLRRYGVKATAPIFIPFMGAFIGMKQLPKDALMEAYVGLGGPVLGSLAAMGAWGLYILNGHTAFLALAYLGVFLNLFNLLPVLPLDGGRAVSALSRWFWVVGLVALVGLMVWWRSPFLLFILLLGWGEFTSAWKRHRTSDTYYQIPMAERLWVGAIYFGLIAALAYSFVQLEPLLISNRPI